MYTIRQAAELVGVQPKLVRRFAGEGKLPGAVRSEGKHGGEAWRLPPDTLEALRTLVHREAEPTEVSAPTAVALRISQVVAAAPVAPVEPPALPDDAVKLLPPTMSEAEVVARHLSPVAAVLNGGCPPASAGVAAKNEHLVPMSVVVELLRAEADQRRQAQRMADDQGATVALLRQTMEQDRDEILRLRTDLLEMRQELQEAQRGLLRLQRKPMPAVDQERATQPLNLETIRQIAAMH